MRKMVIGMVGTVLLSCAAYGQNTPYSPQSCERLAQHELPGAKILLAQTVAAGAFTPPSNSTPRPVVDASFYKTLGAFCRFMAWLCRAPIPRFRSRCGCRSMIKMAARGTGNC